MSLILEVIAELKSREPGESFFYSQVEKKYGIDSCTLARRHQGRTQPNKLPHFSPHPQHKTEPLQ
ncbi:hypothetical protein T440DRAFT_410928 [Plenodomus tracheiphilus IPT5]|uniref:HTH psq-type domain-containing protein n=1 Tax=Plenodomus tracheiphilus IPT5 TaxID=1408161 RepID=A0A6A7AM46_9PLEO|nr:hypothetical protein T440DRAFT_410928 [Plenodomus tracheiphilus IPT5]